MQKMAISKLNGIGSQYLKSTLEGEKGIAGAALSEISANGTIFALMGGARRIATVDELSEGTGESSTQAVEWLARDVERLFSAYPDGSFLFQDLWAHASDVLPSSNPAVFTRDGCVYCECASADLEYNVKRCFDHITSYNWAGMFSLVSRRNLTEVDWINFSRSFVCNLKAVYVGAFDQEGLVIWRRR